MDLKKKMEMTEALQALKNSVSAAEGNLESDDFDLLDQELDQTLQAAKELRELIPHD